MTPHKYLRILFVFSLVFFMAHSALATTVAVGTCLPKLVSFTSIQAAVMAVPPGSTAGGYLAECGRGAWR